MVMYFVKFLVLITVGLATISASAQSSNTPPLRVGVAGLVHGHVGWILNAMKRPDIDVVGIAEPNRELAERYAKQYGFFDGHCVRRPGHYAG